MAEVGASSEWKVTGSVLELYRQELRDLLATSTEQGDKQKKLQIRSEGVEGLLEQECSNPQELSQLLTDAQHSRKTVATAMNDYSSRSHLLFIIKIVSINRETG